MADKTEKQRLLKRIEHLKGLLCDVKRKECAISKSSTHTRSADSQLRQRLAQGAEVLKRSEVKARCQYGHADKRDKVVTVVTSTCEDVAKSQQKQKLSNPDRRKRSQDCGQGQREAVLPKLGECSEVILEGNKASKGDDSVKQAQLAVPNKAVVKRVIVAASSSSSSPGLPLPDAIASAVGSVASGKTHVHSTKRVVLPLQCSSVETASDRTPLRTTSTELLRAYMHTHPSQFCNHPVTQKSGREDSQYLVSQRSVTVKAVSPQTASAAKRQKSSYKPDLAVKKAKVAAARETMQTKIDVFKSVLAQFEAAKKKNKLGLRQCDEDDASKASHCVSARVQSVEGTETETTSKPKQCKRGMGKFTADTKVASIVDDNHVHCKQVCVKTIHSVSQTTGTSLLCPVSHQAVVSAKFIKESDEKPKNSGQVVLENTKEKTCPSTSSNSLCPFLDDRRADSLMSKERNASPSKVSAKENLEKELKATVDKLRDMRKKMGVMLKESPPLSSPSKSVTAVPQMRNGKHVSNAGETIKTAPGIISSPESSVTTRPFPNRKALKWTPIKSPHAKLQDIALVVGSSPNQRCFHQSVAVKIARSREKLWKGQNKACHLNSRIDKSISRGKRSQYTFVRGTSLPAVNSQRESFAQTGIMPSHENQRSSVSKLIVSRYRLHRASHSSPRERSSHTSVLKEVVRKSPYRLRRTSVRTSPVLQPSVPGYSTQTTAVQRAARVIKSKYKMRKVPIVCSSVYRSAFAKQNRHLAFANRQSFQDSTTNVWTTNAKLAASYQHTPRWSSSYPYRIINGYRQKLYYPLNNSYNLRKQRLGYYTLAHWWWRTQHGNKFYQQQRAKAFRGMKGPWKHRSHWMQFSEWQTKAYLDKKEQLQKKMLMKKLHWRKQYSRSGSRKQGSNGSNIPLKGQLQGQRREKLVMINGVVYKSSARCLRRASTSFCRAVPGSSASPVAAASGASLRPRNSVGIKNMKQSRMQTVTVRGVSFKVNARGTRLQRVESNLTEATGRKTAVLRMPTGQTSSAQAYQVVLEKLWDCQRRSLISRAKQRSILLAAAKMRRNNTKGKKTCLFFSRFGKCSRGEECPFLHDPAKVAVCTRFLRGTCRVDNCPFSHKVTKEKMPVCAFFMRGVCTRDNCPYLHVKVNEGAEVCKDFVAGYCPLADKCQKLHTLTCPHFAKSGVCPDGKKCRLQHRKPKVVGRPRVKGSASVIKKHSVDADVSHSLKRPACPDHWSDPPGALGDDGPPKRKRHKAEESKQPASEDRLQTSTVWEVGAQSQHSVKAAWSEGRGRETSPHKLDKLPAFISLLDYSLEESPRPGPADSSIHKPLTCNKGPSLQIKPRI